MTMEREEKGPVPGAMESGTARLWAAAAAVAAFGTWVMFDALPGMNWVLWTGTAAAGLVAFAHHRGAGGRSVLVTGAAATVIAGAAALTASELLHVLICASVIVFLAMQMLLAVDPSPRSITARFAVAAPVVAFTKAVAHAIRRGVEATHRIRSTRARAWVRGLAITLPVLIVFALLLAEADPIFASWRDSVADLFSSWEFLPRVLFFTGLLMIVLGAYGYASSESHDPVQTPENASDRWLGSTERLMLFAAVAALFWLFLALQLGYLFGNLPRGPSSGMTFAEYARRGFGELTIVASASVVLIILAERYGQRGEHGRVLRILTFALITAVLLLLGSAFHRVLLYEAAYGFTTARLYAQAYMTVVAAGLLWLSLEVAGELDAGRLFRRTAAVATILFVALIYWNHEAWIARRNIDRFATTGKLDVAYLARELSPSAIPAIAERLPSLPEPTRSELRSAVLMRYAKRRDMAEGRWFEWNLARDRAREVLTTNFGIDTAAPPIVTGTRP
jgi:hypothetical protein